MADTEGKAVHPTAQRLYLAAKEIRGVVGQSAVARLFGESPQRVKNWEARGVSAVGAIKAEKLLGCSASWVMDGEGEMLPTVAAQEPKGAFIRKPDSQEVEILTHIQHLLPGDKKRLLDQVSELAREREAQRKEILEEAGLDRIQRAAARSASNRRSRTAVDPDDERLRQKSLLNEQDTKK